LFALRQSLAAFHYYQQLVVEVDQEIQRQLGSLETATTAEPTVPKRTKASAYQRRRYEPKTFDLRGELYRIFGVDLTNVPGISAITAQTILCEIGTDVSRFRNASAFASWLGLCPEDKRACFDTSPQGQGPTQMASLVEIRIKVAEGGHIHIDMFLLRRL
jgi:transposase